MNNKLLLPCIVIIFSLLVGCSEKNKDSNEVNVSNSIEKNNSDKLNTPPHYSDATFFKNEYCVIKTTNVRIVDNNAEFSVCIKNKSDKDIEVILNKVNLGISEKEVEFEYKVKANESKYGILKIKNISKIETLNDKFEGRLLINSDEYYFIFK